MSHSAPVVAYATTGAEPFASGCPRLSTGGGPGVSWREAPQTAPGRPNESAITYFHGRNVAKPADRIRNCPNIDLTFGDSWGTVSHCCSRSRAGTSSWDAGTRCNSPCEP